MSTNRTSLPSFKSLFWSDFTIRRSFRGMIMGLVLAAGIWWMLQPVPNALPQPEPPPEVVYGPWVCVGGIVFSVLSAIVLVWRYLFVKQVLLHGTTVTGTVDKMDIYDTNMHSNTGSIRTARTNAYYVTIRYAIDGYDRKARFKLLHSPSTFGIKRDGEVDLLVLDSAPHKPLIRSVYLGRDA